MLVRKSPLILFSIGITAFGASATAEDWKQVGFVEPIQIRVYVDKDSVVDRDKFHTAKMKLEGEESTSAFMAYCKAPNSMQALVFEGEYAMPIGKPFEWKKEGKNLFMSPKTLTAIFNTACKKPWEIWK